MRQHPDHLLSAVHKALAAVDTWQDEPIDLRELAAQSGLSFWHFQRAFRAVVGEPVASYIRRRRLTRAARALRTSHLPVVDIAFAHQFESHEVFTRAFRWAFQRTPSEFRRNPMPLRASRAHLGWAQIEHLRRLDADPVVVSLPPRTLVGLATRYIGVTSERQNDVVVVSTLWQEFFARLDQEGLARYSRVRYGAWDYLPSYADADPDELLYLAAIEVPPHVRIPPDFARWQAPGGRYARFIHRGPVTRIGDTISYLHAAWLPRSGQRRGAGFDYKRFDDRFGDGRENCEIEYHIPLASDDLRS